MENRDVENQPQPSSPKVFVCIYAQEDEIYYRELQKYLVLWERQGSMYWADWTDPTSLQEAALILLLLSPDFFAKTLCYTAMLRAFNMREERRKRGEHEIPLVPIIARTSNWKEMPILGTLKVLPDNEKPVAEWKHREEAYANICNGLTHLLPHLRLPVLGIAPPEPPRIFPDRPLPPGYVPRVAVFQHIKQSLLHKRDGQTTGSTTVLQGVGGFGKTTLALALCYDSEVQAAFPDGILWLQLREERMQEVVMLNHWLSILEGKPVRTGTSEEAWTRWKEAIKQRVCLLVIDDAWHASELNKLLEGGPHCARLITTRNDLALSVEALRVQVDAMEVREASDVLCRDLPEEIHQTAYQARIHALVVQLGCWPLLLTLAHGMLASRVTHGMNIAQALTEVEQAYQTHGVTAFSLESADERYRTIQACMTASIQYLEAFTPSHYHAAERYRGLAVFPEDIDIPVAALHVYWKKGTNLERWETHDLCIRLHELSLLQVCDLEKGIIRLHDVVRNYLEQQTRHNLPTLHERLLEAYWQERHLRRWADLPAEDSYLWHSMVLHFCKAGHKKALLATLTDLLYLARKALYIGVPALENDLLLANTFFPEKTNTTETGAPVFLSLYQMIIRISHLLRQVHTISEIAGLLLSHLGAHPLFAAQRNLLEGEVARPFFSAWLPLPDSSSALFRTLYGHTGGVGDCAVSPDGRWIISASFDGTLKVWDAVTGIEQHTLGHTGGMMSCAVSPDGHLLVSGSIDGALTVWDLATQKELYTLTGHRDAITGCTVSPDSRFIVSTAYDSTLKIWDALTGAERFTITNYAGAISGCAVSPDGRFLVYGSIDGKLTVWDLATQKVLHTLTGHKDVVSSCAVSPDSRFIVSASHDKTLKIWDATTGLERSTLTGHTGEVVDCEVSPDGRSIISAAKDIIWKKDNTLKVWDLATGKERVTLSGHTDTIQACAVSPDGRYVVSASSDKTLKIWDITAEKEHTTSSYHRREVRKCAVISQGRWVVSTDFTDGIHKIWDTTGEGEERFSLSSVLGTLSTFKAWDNATGKEHFTLTGHRGETIDYSVSPDGRYIISKADTTLKVRDILTGRERFSLTGREFQVDHCLVSPDERFLVAWCSDNTFKVWSTAAGKKPLVLTGQTGQMRTYVVSPDSRFIVSASEDGTLRLWNALTGEAGFIFAGHTGWVQECAVSPDSRFVVSASRDKMLKVWDIMTGKECCTLSGHTDSVEGCAVSPDGRHIISASCDKTLKVWESWSGRCVLTFPVDGRLFGCAFHPDGQRLVACGDQGVYFLRLVL